MDSQLRAQVVFHLTGRRGHDEAQPTTLAGLRPALMSAYRDLDSLRYDFPVILALGDGDFAQSLSDAVDAALRAAATPGVSGESLRRRALKIEREIRRLAAHGARGTLLQMWDQAVAALGAGADEAFARDAGRARASLAIDGEVAHCDATLPARFVRHAWRAVQQQKVRAARARIEQLVIRLENVLRADFARSRPRWRCRPCRRRSGRRITACSTSGRCRNCCRAAVRKAVRAAGSTRLVVAGSRTCSRY